MTSAPAARTFMARFSWRLASWPATLVGVRLRARLGEAGTERVTELTLIGSLVLAVASLFR
jgi:hypothetical protein